MIKPGIDGFTVSAIFIDAQPTSDDPLAQREYLGVKFTGGISNDVSAGDAAAAIPIMSAKITELVAAALQAAINKPGETVAKELES